MENGFKVGQTYYPRQPLQPVTPNKSPVKSDGTRFDQILNQQVTQEKFGIEFSQHAKQRLELRGIELSASDIQRLTNAVAKADGKGSKESLVLMDDIAFLVSVTNKKVITAVDGNHMKENIFTNIDSAVVI